MSFDPSSLEAELAKLRPAAPDDALLARLESCAADTWSEPTRDELETESRLRQTAPAPLPPALMASLEQTLSQATFPTAETIVSFPESKPARPASNRNWWSAAAAVALFGATAAFFVPSGNSPDTAAKAPAKPAAAPAIAPAGQAASKFLMPAGFSRGLHEATDEGIVFNEDHEPLRVLKVSYREHATFNAPDGRTHRIEQPHVEYILVPAKTD